MRCSVLVGMFAFFACTASAQDEATLPEASPRLSVVVLPIISTGVDPVVPQRVMESVVELAAELGYDIVSEASLVRAMASVRVSSDPTPAEVWRVTVLAGAQRGIEIRVGVEGSLYAGDVFVASADGAGPFRAHATGDGATFLDNLRETLRQTLPSPSTFDAEAARRYALEVAPTQTPAPTPSWSTATYTRPLTSARRRYPQTRYGLTFVSESAIGRAQKERFYNHILGARMDFTASQNVVIGLFVGYVNLDTGRARTSNLLAYAQLEDRLQFVATGRVRFPLRVAFGYMPFNGPLLRFSGGVRFPLGDSFELGFDLLAPTFWWIPGGGRRVTYDFGAELTYRFGPTR